MKTSIATVMNANGPVDIVTFHANMANFSRYTCSIARFGESYWVNVNASTSTFEPGEAPSVQSALKRQRRATEDAYAFFDLVVDHIADIYRQVVNANEVHDQHRRRWESVAFDILGEPIEEDKVQAFVDDIPF